MLEEEFEFERGWLWTVVHQVGWILSSFAHVHGPEVEGALLASTLFEDDRQVLLHAGGGYLNHLACLLALDVDLYLLGYDVCGVRHQTYFNPDDLVWLNTEVSRLYDHT